MTQTRRAFTLVELMVVITIVIILVGILMIAVSKSMTAGRRVRAQADLQSIATALEAYRQDFGDYPRPDANFDASTLLCRVLVAPGPDVGAVGDLTVDGALGPGFRVRGTQGKVYGPYIDLEKFDLTVYTNDGTNHYVRSKVYTSNSDAPVPPILYIPKNIRPIQPADSYVAGNTNAMYDVSSLLAVPNIGNNAWWPQMPLSGGMQVLSQIQRMMGNKNQTLVGGHYPITGNDVPATTAPYILWMPGADGMFGLTNSKGARDIDTGANTYTTDDVTNFNFDPAITVK